MLRTAPFSLGRPNKRKKPRLGGASVSRTTPRYRNAWSPITISAGRPLWRLNEFGVIYKKRFAVKRNSNTEPDTTATVVILITLRTAVDTTIGKRHAEGDVACTPLELDRFFAAMTTHLWKKGQAVFRPDRYAFRRVGPDLGCNLSRLTELKA